MAQASTRPGWGGALLCLAALLHAGCSSWSSSGGGPLASASPLDREFAVAAVTWDLNKDGDVTCAEWKQYVTELFREADADRDGYLTPEEFGRMSRIDRLFEIAGFAYYDSNNDKRISLAEMTDKPNPAFALLDKNKDCVISADERVHRRGVESTRDPSAAPPQTGKQKR